MRLCLIALNRRLRSIAGAAWLLAGILTGCHGSSPFTRTDSPPKPVDEGMVIHAGQVETAPVVEFKGAAEFAEAQELYRAQDYKKAGKLFGRVADDTHNPPLQAEKARFFEAECDRARGYYPDAMHTYNRMLMDFQYGVYREQAVARMFEICDYWLDDTRKQLDAEKEKAEGKRYFTPWNFVHFDKSKPSIDEEGHALKMLMQVHIYGADGPHSEKALFLAGYIHFARGNFREADQILSELIDVTNKNGKSSEFRDRAIELAILAKNNASGGAKYDGRKAAEALKLIELARRTSPELAAKRGEFLDNQAKTIRYIQAEKDYDIAEHYRKTGNPAAAWFCYELVRRRYQGTPFHDKAVAHMTELHNDLKSQQDQSEFAKATRREWNKITLGHDTPTLAAGRPLPPLPEAAPNVRDATNPVVPVENRQAVPNEPAPRQ